MTGGALLGLVMLIVMIGAIFIGFPISFTLLFLALAFGYFGLGGHTVFDLAYNADGGHQAWVDGLFEPEQTLGHTARRRDDDDHQGSRLQREDFDVPDRRRLE